MSTPRRAAPKDTLERLLAGPVVWIGLVVLTAFALGPFIWMLLTSLKDRQELYATPLQYLPVHPTFENYVEAWTSPVTPFSRFFLNSLWVCSVTMVATTAEASSRVSMPGRSAIGKAFGTSRAVNGSAAIARPMPMAPADNARIRLSVSS
jgi:ABC-type glycerol-3-phosphate transport system permease component